MTMANTPAQVALDEKGLVPCPFEDGACDKEALIVVVNDDPSGRANVKMAWVSCEDCGARGPVAFAHPDDVRGCAVHSWNGCASLWDDGRGALVERTAYDKLREGYKEILALLHELPELSAPDLAATPPSPEPDAELVKALERASLTIKRYRRAGHGDDVFFSDLCESDDAIDAVLRRHRKQGGAS